MLSPRNYAKAVSIMALTLYANTARAEGSSASDLQEPSAQEHQANSQKVGVAEIVVTAQKRSENLQKVPIAISALSSEAIASRSIDNVQGVVAAIPTLYSAPYPTSNTSLFLFMRGMGVGDPMQVTKDGSIGIYENGIYNPRPQNLAFDLADVERIEVLRGPQGTLYGRNTTGGAMAIVARAPTGELGVREVLSYGSRNQYQAVTHLDLPEWNGFAFKFSFAAGGDDGWGKNVKSSSVPDTNNFDSESHVAGRFAARWRPTSKLTVDYSFEAGQIKSTPILLQSAMLTGMVINPPYTYSYTPNQAYRPTALPESNVQIRDQALVIGWDVADHLTVKSLTGLNYYNGYSFADTSEIFLLPLTSGNTIVSNVLSEDLQAIGSTMNSRIKYTFGLYYYRENATHWQDNTYYNVVDAGLHVFNHAESKAVYGQVTYNPPVLGDRLDLTLGGRYTWDKRDVERDNFTNGIPTETNLRHDQEFGKFTPTFTANLRWTNHISTYAKVATGYRAGGASEAAPAFNTYSPETLTSYEAGLKSELFDRHLRLNVAAFYNKYRQMQLDVTPDPTNVAISLTQNAGSATIKGVEADITAVLTRNLTLNVSYAYLGTKVNYVSVNGGPNIAGYFAIPYAPKHSVNASADWSFLQWDSGSLRLFADVSYKGRNQGTAGDGPAVPNQSYYEVPAYAEANARLTWTAEKLLNKPVQFSLWAKNLTNNIHQVYSAGPGAYTTGYLFHGFALSAPRSVGVAATLNF